MSSNEAGTEHDLGIDRRTVLRKGAVSAGGLALGAAAFSGTVTADQWDAVVDQTGVKLDEPLFVNCLGESLTITSGTARFDTDVRRDDGGGFHMNARVVVNATLEGDETGTKYQNSFTFNRSEYVDADEKPFTTTVTGNFKIIGKGQAPNLRVRVRNQLTFNANGDLSVAMSYEAVECMR